MIRVAVMHLQPLSGCGCSTKHAYLVFPEKELAAAVVEHANSNPLELNGRQLLVRHYTEPPSHIPEGAFPFS